MKHLLIAILVMASFTAKSQSIDTSFHYCVAAKVDTVVLNVNYPSLDTCSHLGIVKKDFDYTTNQITITYYWGNPLRNVKGGTYVINDTEERTTYDIFRLLANFLNITFK